MSVTVSGVELQPYHIRDRQHAVKKNGPVPSTPKVHDHGETTPLMKYPSIPTTQYQFRRDKIWQWTPDFTVYEVDLTDPSLKATRQHPVYHARICEWTRNTPDVTLQDIRPSASGQTLAVSYFRWSRTVRMGVGDPQATEANDTLWEDMRNVSKWYFHCKYEFSWPKSHQAVQNPFKDNSDEGRRRYQWRRTKSEADGVHGWWTQRSSRHYKLIDMTTGEVLAVYISRVAGGWKRMGELNLYGSFSKEFETVIVLSTASLAEKIIRRVRKYTRRVGGP